MTLSDLIELALIQIPEVLHGPDRHVRADWRCPTQIPSIRNNLFIEPHIHAVSLQCLLGHSQILHERQGRFSKGQEVGFVSINLLHKSTSY